MEQDQEKKYVCKLCNKSFLNERVLEGHMRTYVVADSAQEEVKLENGNMGFEGYVLRENPKKSWKFSRFNNGESSSMQGSVKCNVCGKEFWSPRSLHGHMRHHSGKQSKGIHCKECGKRFRSPRSLSGHMRLHSGKFRVSTQAKSAMTLSDADIVNLVRRKRSNRMRCKVTSNSSFSSLNEPVSGFENEQVEVEEVAMCLMMLSRGVREFDEFNSVDVSMDNNSLFFEDRFVHRAKLVQRNNDDDVVSEGNELVCASYSECCGYDCEIACSEEKMVELEVPIGSFYKAVSTERPKMDNESGGKGSDEEVKSDLMMDEDGLDLPGLEFAKSSQNDEAMFDAGNDELGNDSDKQTTICCPSDSDVIHDSRKKSEFKCRMCNKIFATYQALGGHQTLHRMPRSSISVKNENFQKDISPVTEVAIKSARFEHIEDSMEQEMHGVNFTGCESGKSKEYKCPFCFKTFVSGQALGGHKRVHLVKSREQTIQMKQDSPNTYDASDMTLADIEADNLGGFRSWWAGSGCKHEPLVGLVAN